VLTELALDEIMALFLLLYPWNPSAAQQGQMVDELESKSMVAAAQELRSSTMRKTCLCLRKETCDVSTIKIKLSSPSKHAQLKQ
jgi:hypothetical protein